VKANFSMGELLKMATRNGKNGISINSSSGTSVGHRKE